ncbi:VOC family protein [Paenarthrobacter sp. A20]|uniref:VOC family protein n=1 Tax=Paenarthrobacter sp. A20 TaxID=2817891 RepID=UPI00209F7E73|nr:VOC family protein [Paenarthrobacter sp. A20]MCP1410860.1 putative enzyme related to lactoylglutathione lyase [Paenarthrobacter sp. A20]
MTSRKRYASGEPCWADLQTRDVAAAKDFYQHVFGWSYQDLPTPDGRSYAQAFVKDQLVAVIAPQNPMQEAAGTHGQWNVYIAATDTEEIADDAVHAGGKLQFGPEAVADTGVLAFIEPPGGGTTGIWQAGTHRGSHLFNEPGALAWAELLTPEPQAAVGFFQELFAHEVTEYPQDDGGSYSTLMVNGDEVAGVVPAGEGDEPGWQIYFAVADLRKAVEAAAAAGGEVLVEAEDHPETGSLATIQDPQGGVLSLIQV